MFCDWMQVWQDHPRELPREFVTDYTIRIDDAGEIKHTGATPFRVEGSHSSSLSIRAYENKVSFSGNVGRFGRADNVLNFDVDQTKQLINIFVSAMGLPEFTGGHVSSTAAVVSDRDTDRNVRTEHISTGAKVVRVDLTENWSAGSHSDAVAYTNYLTTVNYGRTRSNVYGDGETVVIGDKSRYKYEKVYIKSCEMNHRSKKTGVDQELIDYVEDQGIVRYELELKQACDRLGIRPWNKCTQLNCEEIFEKYQGKVMRQANIVEPTQLPTAMLKTYALHKAGINVKEQVSRATFYRHRKVILEELGIDISRKRKPEVEAVRVIRLRPVVVPDKYVQQFDRTAMALREAANEIRKAG